MSIRYASAFLSHSSAQHDFVRRVNDALVRRGVVTWLDRHALAAGVNLDEEIHRGAASTLALIAFLSEESLASAWCNEELAPRLRATTPGHDDAIIPVFFGDPVKLVSSNRTLRDRWLSPDGTRVNKLGIPANTFANAVPDEIAAAIARSLYQRIHCRDAGEFVVVIDQRGNGRRAGEPDDALIPPNLRRQPWPALVFRPDSEMRSEAEVLHGTSWLDVRDAFLQANAEAWETLSEREVHVTGNMQLALAWLVGRRFDRSTRSTLTVRNLRNGHQLRLAMRDGFDTPLTPLDPSAVQWETAAPAATDRVVSVAIAHDTLRHAIRTHRHVTGDVTPLAVHDAGQINDTNQVVELARWLAAAAQGQRDVVLYTALPVQALVLLAALSKHSVGRVTFMEYDRAMNTYHPCEMPRA